MWDTIKVVDPVKSIMTDGEVQGKPINPKRKRKVIIALTVSAIVIIAVVYLALFNPSTAIDSGVHDSDGDGYADGIDIFPNDPTEWVDYDGDGYGDNSDAFPNLASEHLDSDEDGVGDNSDAFPHDSTEWTDYDGDGYGDNSDAFPNLASEHLDSDEDGVGDNSDAFPMDSTQTTDRDGDGYGDNSQGTNPDKFPDDPFEWADSDLDGVGNNADFYDLGNGKIKIAITWFQCDGTADPLGGAADPYFVISVDVNSDGIYESIHTSTTRENVNTVLNPYFIIIDLPDDISFFKFNINVFDSDPFDADDPIDYCPSSAGYSYLMTAIAPYSNSWSHDGANDMLSNEIDCELDYSISIVS